MKMIVVGIGQRNKGDRSKKTGKPYDGASIYCLREKSGIEGQEARELYFNFLSSVTYPAVDVGDIINVDYDDKGFVDSVEVLKKADVNNKPNAKATA
jgi:uncharacterized protein YuzE